MKWNKVRPYMLCDANHWKRWFYAQRDSWSRRLDWEAVLDSSAPLCTGAKRQGQAHEPHAAPLVRILYVAPKYDYGNPGRGLSFEESNFFHTLWSLGHELFRFDYLELMQRFGRRKMNQMLVEAVYRYAPELMFVVLFENELDGEVLREISAQHPTVTLNWFCDDQWRFESYSCRRAPEFNWVVTTVRSCVARYHQIGCRNVIHCQWACNHFLYRRMNLPLRYDVSFVGQPHGRRGRVIDTLRRAGIRVSTWGHGWKSGRVSLMEMVRIFNQSRINLNLSKSSTLEEDQIKGRDFEIPGSGGFLLTGFSDGLDDYFEPGKEVACYRDVDHMIELIRYYLRNEEEREAIAQAGHQRVLRDHTYQIRFQQIFDRVAAGRAEGCMAGR